jgi:monooxygenase
MSGLRSVTSKFDHVDVLIVGAGISGIGVACHLAKKQPGRTFAIVDRRDAIGGTWDLFRYPGIRSDADLHTFGFEFKPWTRDNAIADAHEILDYLQETIDENDLASRIHLGLKVLRADFSREQGRWTVTLERVSDGEQFDVTCAMLVSAAGYYDYDGGYTPEFEGREDFRGDIVHPQQWPEDLDYSGKKVVVIGSGATAVTLLPAMADKAGHVTMLQRSPSYVLSIPRQDSIANTLRRLLPDRIAYAITRKININRQHLIYTLSQRYPAFMRRVIRSLNVRALPEGYAVDTHFNPRYNPWDQRLCMVPDSDMFKAISRGAASVVTDRIARFTEKGILLGSGIDLDADIIVTATGLKTVPFGKIALHVDGQHVDLHTLGERRPLHVVGNSLGGAVALQLLDLEPNRVASLVLANSAGFGAEVALPLRLMAVPVLGELATRRTTRASARITERMLYADRALASKGRIEHALAIAGQPDPATVMLETARHLGTRYGIKAAWRAELITAASRYPRPTLLLWGDRDRILPSHHLDAARRLIPHAQTHLFTGVGHMPQIERPDEFAAQVLTFLADIAQAEHTDPEHSELASSV